MPTYEYKREDGSTFEIEQRITAPSLAVCPTTGQKVKRIISAGAGLVFKGSGFYQTDYVRKSSDSKTGDSKTGDSKNADSKTKSTAAGTSDSAAASSASETSKSDTKSSDSKKDSSGS